MTTFQRHPALRTLVMMVALAITVWTGAEYVIEALKLRASGIRARQQHLQEGKP